MHPNTSYDARNSHKSICMKLILDPEDPKVGFNRQFNQLQTNRISQFDKGTCTSCHSRSWWKSSCYWWTCSSRRNCCSCWRETFHLHFWRMINSEIDGDLVRMSTMALIQNFWSTCLKSFSDKTIGEIYTTKTPFEIKQQIYQKALQFYIKDGVKTRNTPSQNLADKKKILSHHGRN